MAKSKKVNPDDWPRTELGPQAQDITGMQYGRLRVIHPVRRPNGGKLEWLALCDCGRYTIQRGTDLRRGLSRSCGCLQRELTSRRRRQHGMADSPEYKTWSDIRNRCQNPNSQRYPQYGARGIEVCSRWQDSFEAFYADMGPRPDGCSLDRVDNNGPYSPENCRWAGAITQANNKRSNLRVRWFGITQTLAEWARVLDVPYRTLQSRYRRGNLFGELVEA